MKVLLDIDVDKNDAFIPSLLNNKLIHFIAQSSKELEWWLIADETRAKEFAQSNIKVIPSPDKTNANVLSRFLAKKALKNLVIKLKPQLIISSELIYSGAVNCYLLQSHKQFRKLKTGQLRSYQFILATSFELKQLLLHHSVFPSEKIYVTGIDTENEYVPFNIEEQQAFKNKMSSGYQYFLVNNEELSVKQAVPLLKAFSLFKKRLQTGMKLMLNSSSKFDDELLALLSSYKYKQDVLLINQTAHQMLNALTASAYASIQFAQNDSMILPQQMIAAQTPVIMLQPQKFEQQEGLFVYADESNADDIAWKMMLLYKDEMYRNKIVLNAQQSVSAYTSNTLPSFIQILSANRFQQNQ
jgi:hypothetical protein